VCVVKFYPPPKLRSGGVEGFHNVLAEVNVEIERDDIDEGWSESLVLLRRALVVVLLSYFL
jgi:hypothetical protein